MSAIAVSGKLANILLDFAISIYLHFPTLPMYRMNRIALFYGALAMKRAGTALANNVSHSFYWKFNRK